MGEIDFKQIGMAAKDIVVGIGAAAAGASGGPAAAEGVMKAGSGIDKLVEVAVPADKEKKQTRADKFDRSDFNNGKAAAPASSAPRGENTKAAQAAAEPVDVDAKATADYLAARGWPPEKVQQIIRGPGVGGQTTLSSIVGKEVGGTSVRLASGDAVDLKKGTAIDAVAGSPVASVRGEAQTLVTGSAVKGSAGTDSA